ncbi:MAG: Hpt domain-containing protein [Solirubrobacterales bacterium]
MGDNELLEMLVAETDRRRETILKGVEDLAASGEADPKRVEAMRIEAHGIKGAAMVVGQDRLAELALRIEDALAAQTESGEIAPAQAAGIVAGVSALHEGAEAAAEGIAEPTSVGRSLEALS